LLRPYTTLDNHDACAKLKTLNIAKIACEHLANIVWSEYPNISVTSKSDTTEKTGGKPDTTKKPSQDIVLNVLNDNKFWDMMTQYVEYMGALGGFMIKCAIVEVNVTTEFYPATNFKVLSHTNRNINSVEFYDVSKITRNNVEHELKLIERHDFNSKLYTITNSATLDDKPVSLDSVAEGLVEYVEFTNMKRPFFAYFRTPMANNIELESPLGISLFSNALGSMEDIDYSFNYICQDQNDNKTRIFVKDTALRSKLSTTQDKAMQRYYPKDGIFQVMSSDTDSNTMPVVAVSNPLHTTDIVMALKAQLEIFAKQTGFSSGTFTFDGVSVKTATEVISQESETYRTKTRYEGLIETGIQETIYSISELVKLASGVDLLIEDIVVQFNDSVSNNKESDITENKLMVDAGFQSRAQAIMNLFGCTEEEANIRLDKIELEKIRLNNLSKAEVVQ